MRQAAHTIEGRARDLERVPLTELRQQVGDPLAQLERHALRVIDEEADQVATDLGEQYLDLGFRLCETGLDLGLNIAHVTSSSQ